MSSLLASSWGDSTLVLNVDPARIRAAWIGRISGCLCGKPVEAYLRRADASWLRGTVPVVDGTPADSRERGSMFNRSRTVFTWLTICALLAVSHAAYAAESTHHPDRSVYRAPHADEAPIIDGVDDDAAWADAAWQELKYNWLGPEYTAEDFSGRYKVVWTEERIYLLAEITDDVLYDIHRHPLKQYWDDDCLEIFLDEDFSGGDHQFNHNAFAYHMSLDNRAIDIGTDQQARDYTHHVQSQWRQHGDKLIWEVAIDIYTDAYVDDADDNAPIRLEAGKVMGLMVAYCDNDRSELRENFVGSEITYEGKTDHGWIDAGLFGKLILDD